MRKNGYSLLELIIVLILISLSTALVTPSLSRFSKTIELKASAKKVSGVLRYCRSEAINKGLVYQVIFNPELREVMVQSIDLNEEKKEGDKKEELSGKTYSLPQGIEMKEVNLTSPNIPLIFQPLSSIQWRVERRLLPSE